MQNLCTHIIIIFLQTHTHHVPTTQRIKIVSLALVQQNVHICLKHTLFVIFSQLILLVHIWNGILC